VGNQRTTTLPGTVSGGFGRTSYTWSVRRVQAIDIGTNSVRSIIVEVADDGSFRVIDDEKATTRLGTGLVSTGALDERSMQETSDALRAFLDIGTNLAVALVRAVATAAVRMASNGPVFVERLSSDLGLEVEVIPAEEEGRLVFVSAAAHFQLVGRSTMVDIGGGSVELVSAHESHIEHVASVTLGARVLSEQFVDSDPISDSGFSRMRQHVRSTLRDAAGSAAEPARLLIGSGGSVTSVGAIVAARRGRKADNLQGFEVTRAEVTSLLADLSTSTAESRRKMAGLQPERADIILAGVLVLAEVMKLCRVDSLFINARGIREGIVIDTVRRSDSLPLDRAAAVRRFGASCGFDEAHAEQVAWLALQLFDQLKAPLELDPEIRPILEAAAWLHDVGYHVAYDRHHRHSYHLVMHSGLPGFTSRELRLVASTARYHTKSLPKAGHEAWGSLESADKALVEPAAALLRLADGLDRGRGAHVKRMSAVVGDNGLRIVVFGEGAMHPELYGVAKKRDLFERVFDMPVHVTIGLDARAP